MFIPHVPASEEWRRIDALPRRTYTPEEIEALVASLSEALRTPLGTQRLLPAQAIALVELGMYGRLMCPLRPGAGKSLVCYLAPYVMNRRRALLLLPGKHVEPKRGELVRYGVHWKVAWWLRFLSYQSLSRVSHETFLDDFRPDIILADEAHKLKNPKAGVTKRLRYYLDRAGDTCTFIPLSGTFSDRDPGDWVHLGAMSLGDQAPLPHRSYKDLQLWIQALGEKLNGPRARPGALARWSDGNTDLDAVRKGFGRRVRETPAVVATESPLPSITLEVSRIEVPSDPKIEEAYALLKAKWCAPDGWPLTQGLQVWQLARQLKHGFYYYHHPRPPQEYLDRRREWGQFVRKHLNASEELATELQIVQRCLRGDIDPTAYQAWKEVEATYTGQRYVQWLSTSCLDLCIEWLKTNGKGSICWTEFEAFGDTLAHLTGLPYHGSAGLDASGMHLEKRQGEPVISGMGSSEGLNLQHGYAKNLLTSPMAKGRAWEQWLARTHRIGQPAEEVCADILSGCRADEEAWDQANADARYLTETDCLQRLDVADKYWEADLGRLVHLGSRWKLLAKPT